MALSISSISAASCPVSIIFLDIDRVLIGDRATPPLSQMIREKVKELFVEKEGYNCGFTELEWRIAASHFLCEQALGHFENLIKRVNQVARVAIVVSSAWRLDGTVEDLRTRMFAVGEFPKLIIDKTCDPDWRLSREERERITTISTQKYGFSPRNRGCEIDFWLRENHPNFDLRSFVILDDEDDGISERYPDNFVKVNFRKLFSPSDADRAYAILTESTFSPDIFPIESAIREALERKTAPRRGQSTDTAIRV